MLENYENIIIYGLGQVAFRHMKNLRTQKIFLFGTIVRKKEKN